MITVELDNFSLREICRSGQCFRMHETAENNTYELVAGDKYLKISQAGSIVNFYCSDVEFICYWVPYFDIDSDYGRYIEKVNPRDTYLSAAVQCGNGIRILRQDLWEMIITFLISQQNNISRIRSCIERLCVRYGEKLKAGDIEYYSFPTPVVRGDRRRTAEAWNGIPCQIYRGDNAKHSGGRSFTGKTVSDEVLPQSTKRTDEAQWSRRKSSRLHLSVCIASHGCIPDRYAYPAGS